MIKTMETLKNIVVQFDERTEAKVIAVKNITEEITKDNIESFDPIILNYSKLSTAEKKTLDNFVTLVKSKL